MADHPLRPATDRSLGRPLPHQQANRTQAPPQAAFRPLDLSLHAVLATVSRGCPPPEDRFLRVTHPSATDSRSCPCDLHVLSMPPAFALSQDQTLRFISRPLDRNMNRPELVWSAPGKPEQPSKRNCSHQRRYVTCALKAQPTESECHSPRPPVRPLDQPPACAGATQGRRQRIPS